MAGQAHEVALSSLLKAMFKRLNRYSKRYDQPPLVENFTVQPPMNQMVLNNIVEPEPSSILSSVGFGLLFTTEIPSTSSH